MKRLKNKIYGVLTGSLLLTLSLSIAKSTHAQTPLYDDLWVLESMPGVSLNESHNKKDYPRGLPQLELKKENSQISGSSGCNRFTGTYKINKNKITLGALAMTKMACPGSGEQQFLDRFNQVKNFEIKQYKLYLQTESGKDLLIFHKID